MYPDEKMMPLDTGTRASHTWEWLLANGFLPFSEADKGRTVEIKDGKVRVDDAEQRVRWLGEASPADCAGNETSKYIEDSGCLESCCLNALPSKYLKYTDEQGQICTYIDYIWYPAKGLAVFDIVQKASS